MTGAHRSERVRIDIADVNACAFLVKGTRNGGSDAIGSGGDEDAQSLDVQVHEWDEAERRLACNRRCRLRHQATRLTMFDAPDNLPA